MATNGKKSTLSVGYLTVCEHEGQGFFGGYLVLNTSGRPLEFHCTAPVKPGRAQEILYGATLRPYLYGQQIGQALLKKSRVTADVVFTDQEPVLAIREFIDQPVVFAAAESDDLPQTTTVASTPRIRVDDTHHSPQPFGMRLRSFTIGPRQLAVLEAYPRDAEVVQREWERYVGEVDLQEPFCRIREAIDEARKTTR